MGKHKIRPTSKLGNFLKKSQFKGDGYKKIQQKFSLRPVLFSVTHPYINPVIKRLRRKLRGLDKKYELMAPYAYMIGARIAFLYQKYSARKSSIEHAQLILSGK